MKETAAARPDVLIVDDDPTVLVALSVALEARGARVATAASADEARRRLDDRRFALVVTDLRLEEDDGGLTVARAARRTVPRARVVLISGADLDEISDEAADAGVDEMIAKPVPTAVLDRLLDELVAATVPPRARGLDDAAATALLTRFVTGDDDAFSRLATAYRPLLYSIFLRWFRLEESDADDLYQEVLLQLVTKAPEVRDVRRWLMGTAVNQAKKRIRTLIRQRRLAERWGAEQELTETPERTDIRQLLELALAQLSPRDQRLLRLIYLEERSYQETAAILGRPIGSIGPLRGRALRRLLAAVTALERRPDAAMAA